MSLIFLVGMPAAGKTYWGRLISQAYDWDFIDMDEYLEATYQQTIPDIFEQEGEISFREKEQAALHKIITGAKGNTVIACGGGTVAFFNNLNDMKAAGCVIYLQADIELLLSRIEKSRGRPLFQNEPDVKQKIETLLYERIAFFEQAHHIIPGQNISVLTFEKIIQQCTERQ
jgi:shikimate kinase